MQSQIIKSKSKNKKANAIGTEAQRHREKNFVPSDFVTL
jgi:hypothetical protein